MAGYKINAIINFADPENFREIIVPQGINLHQLHEIIQIVFGFKNYHDYEFVFENNSTSYQNMEDDLTENIRNSNNVIIDDIFDNPGIIYLYDFDDEWVISVLFEEKIEDYSKNFPILGKCQGKYNPPEDVGGVAEFIHLIEMEESPVDYSNNEDYVKLELFNKDKTSKILESMKF